MSEERAPYGTADIDPAEQEYQAWVADAMAEIPVSVADEGTHSYALDREAAERVVKRLARLDAEQKSAVEFIDSEIEAAEAALEALKARRDEILAPYRRRAEWYYTTAKPVLHQWTADCLRGRMERSIKLAYGTAKLRTSPAKTMVVDEAEALAWCEANRPEAVKRSVLVTPVTKWIQETGEVPPGFDRVPGEETFSLEVEVGQ